MKLIVNGAGGRMGGMLVSLIDASNTHTLVCAADPAFGRDCPFPRVKSLFDYRGEADCVIDFSDRRATRSVCEYAVGRRLPLVVATTGQTAAEREMIASASAVVPVFFSANMSAGAALAARLVRTAASFFPEAEIEIVETHRSGKIDVPSGTAVMLADEIKKVRGDAFVTVGRRQGGRKKGEICIHSLRLGGSAGRHEVIICAGSQTITICHEAHDRRLFAEGAIAAAEYVVRRLPGIYTMRNLADEN